MMPAPARHYGNFEDGFGLVGRMIRSRSRAAHWALALAGTRLAFTPIDRVCEPAERRRLAASGRRSAPMLLVVGAPRSGTTLAYQVLADALDVSYLTNAAGLAARSPITISRAVEAASRVADRLGRRHGGDQPTNYLSYYGNTSGLRAPNDGFLVWNRWLGTSRYRGPDELSAETVADMANFFATWADSFRAPFLNKNNRNSDCVELLAAALPGAHFIDIRRDRRAVARSLIEARSLVQGSTSRPWGLASSEDDESDQSPVEQVCRQVMTIEAMLDQAASALGPSRHLRIDYADLCERPGGEVRRVLDAFPIARQAVHCDLDRIGPFDNADHDKPRGTHDDDIDRTFATLDREMASAHRPRDRAHPDGRHSGEQPG